MAKVIAYCTSNSQYVELIKKLKASCEEFDIKIMTREYDDRGTWELNCAIKSEFILDMLRSFPGDTLVYIDADAVVKKPLDLDFGGMDFGCYFLNDELLSGTLFFHSNERTIDFVAEWVRDQKQDPNVWDQKVLQATLESYQKILQETTDGTDSLKIMKLTASYCKIFDNINHKDVDPVIEHFQASRKEKRDRKIGSCELPKKARIQPDGSITLLHSRPKDVKFLDKHFKRRHPNLERWLPDLETLDEADLDYSGKIGYIVGKGPSLDSLGPDDFDDDGPIIAINEALTKLEQLNIPNPTYLVQDPALREFANLQRATAILEDSICGLYRKYPNKLQYSQPGMGLPRGVLSAIVAIRILQQWNVTSIVLLAFDACVNQDTNYAKIVGYESSDKKRDPRRFLKHKPMLVKNLAGTAYSFRLAGKIY